MEVEEEDTADYHTHMRNLTRWASEDKEEVKDSSKKFYACLISLVLMATVVVVIAVIIYYARPDDEDLGDEGYIELPVDEDGNPIDWALILRNN